MIAVPVEIAVTKPAVPTVATEGVLLLHVPPEPAVVNVAEPPKHIVATPEIAYTAPLTDTAVVTVHPPSV